MPGTSYSSRDENPKSCVGFYCLYEPTHNTPGAPKFSNDEICRNGIVDNDNGRVDEDPYCPMVSGVSAPPPPLTNNTFNIYTFTRTFSISINNQYTISMNCLSIHPLSR